MYLQVVNEAVQDKDCNRSRIMPENCMADLVDGNKEQSSLDADKQNFVMPEAFASQPCEEESEEVNATAIANVSTFLTSICKSQVSDIYCAIRNRQEDTSEHLITRNIYTPSIVYNAKTNPHTSRLKPINSSVIHEFDKFGDFAQIQDTRKKRPVRRKKEEVDVIDDGNNRVVTASNLLVSAKMLSMYLSSSTLITADVLNLIWKHYFQHDTPLVICSNICMLLEQYFQLHFGFRGCNREALMNSLLSSFREVHDRTMFSKFDKENRFDLDTVVSFLTQRIETSLQQSPNEPKENSKQLLRLIIKICKLDFHYYWKYDRADGKFPLIFYLFGANGFSNNAVKLIPKLLGKFVINDIRDELHIRELLALLAMMSHKLDARESNQKLYDGSKVRLAESVSRVLRENNDDKNLVFQLQLITPSWFSFLVARDIYMKRSCNSSLATLQDIVSVKQSSNNDIILEVLMYKYFALSSIHVALRAHQFFNSSTLRPSSSKFYTYNAMTKLNMNEKKKSSIVFKNQMKFDVRKLTDDLSCLLQISNGSKYVGLEESLLFVMTQDKAWCL